MPDLTLYQFTLSPYCIKVRRILEYKRLPYSTVEVNPLARGEVVRLSGQQRLPVLVEDGPEGSHPPAEDRADWGVRSRGPQTVVFDSTHIAEYLDRRYPDRPVYPAAPAERARVKALEDWSDEVFAHDLIPFKIFTPGNAAKMVAQSKPFYPTRWYYELIYPFGPLVLRSLTRRRRAGRSGEVLRRDYVRDLDLLDGMAGAGTDLRADHPTVFDFAVWGLLRTMEGLRGEELLASRIHLAAWYAAMAR